MNAPVIISWRIQLKCWQSKLSWYQVTWMQAGANWEASKVNVLWWSHCKIVQFYNDVPDRYLHPPISVALSCVSWGMSGDCHWPWKASLCMELGQQDRYQEYPSHGDAQMTSFSGTPSECLQHHLDQENLKIVRERLPLKQVPAYLSVIARKVSTCQECFIKTNKAGSSYHAWMCGMWCACAAWLHQLIANSTKVWNMCTKMWKSDLLLMCKLIKSLKADTGVLPCPKVVMQACTASGN